MNTININYKFFLLLLVTVFFFTGCQSKLEQAQDPSTSPSKLSELIKDDNSEVRLSATLNPSLPDSCLVTIAKIGDKDMKIALLERNNITTNVLNLLAKDDNAEVRAAIAQYNNLSFIDIIKRKKQFLIGILNELSNDNEVIVRTGVANNSSTSPSLLDKLSKDTEKQVRLSVASNSNTNPVTLFRLSKDGQKEIREAVAQHENIGPRTALTLSKDEYPEVRIALAQNPNTPLETLTLLARDNDPTVKSKAQNTGSNLPLIDVELVQAQRRGLVAVRGSGDGLTSLKLELELKVVRSVKVKIQPGTIFNPSASGTQSMVVTSQREITLTPFRIEASVTLNAACANMHLGVPGSDDRFTIRRSKSPNDLIKLLNLSDFQSSSIRVKQFAIWTITDNPSRNNYVGIGFHGFGSGPSDDEMAKIRELFRKANIYTRKYRAFQ